MKRFPKMILIVFFLFSFSNPVFPENLRLLVWEGYAPADKIQGFENFIEKKYKKKITLDINSTISDPNDFYDAVRGNRTDIFSPAHNLLKDNLFGYISKNLLLPIDLKNIPNYENILPYLKQADYITDNGKVYGIPFAYGVYGLAYNTTLVKEKPDTWEILWRPEYRNKYSISADYYEANIYITGLALGRRGMQIWDFESMKNPEFKNKLEILAKNTASFWKSVDRASDLTGLALATSWGFSLPELKKSGEIWKMAEPKEGVTGWVDNFVICRSLSDKPFLKTVAEEWLNYVLSPEYQKEVVIRRLNCNPVNLATKKNLSPEAVSEYHLNDPDYLMENMVLWPTIQSQRVRNGMKYLWNQALK